MSERDAAVRELALRAALKPVNLIIPAAVLAVGLVTGIWPLYLGAVALYAVLAGTTFFSVDEGRKVIAERRRATLAPPDPEPVLRDPLIRARYAEARDEEARIRAALAESPVPLPEVEVEIAGLMADVRHLCAQAEVVAGYLGTVDRDRLVARLDAVRKESPGGDPDLESTLRETSTALGQQISTIDEMDGHLRRFHARMTQLTSTMGAIRAQMVRLQVQAQPDAGERVRGQLASARELVSGLNEAMDDAADRAGGAGV